MNDSININNQNKESELHHQVMFGITDDKVKSWEKLQSEILTVVREIFFIKLVLDLCTFCFEIKNS